MIIGIFEKKCFWIFESNLFSVLGFDVYIWSYCL